MPNIAEYLNANLVLVYFVYGLAFFGLGLVLTLACSRSADLRFMMAIRPLAGFGFLHGIHEWIDMFQLIRRQTTGIEPSAPEEILRLVILVGSFSLLLAFAAQLLEKDARKVTRRTWLIEGVPMLLWIVAALLILQQRELPLIEQLLRIDVLARYTLGLPGALLAGIALLAQQRAFREAHVKFGRDLVWCASALILYGVVGQIFVHPSGLPPSDVLNSETFLTWFGFPVQLFRAAMAIGVTVGMMRVLLAFELDNIRRLDDAHQAEMSAHERTLAVERRAREAEEQHASELRRQARELALLARPVQSIGDARRVVDAAGTCLAPSGEQYALFRCRADLC